MVKRRGVINKGHVRLRRWRASYSASSVIHSQVGEVAEVVLGAVKVAEGAARSAGNLDGGVGEIVPRSAPRAAPWGRCQAASVVLLALQGVGPVLPRPALRTCLGWRCLIRPVSEGSQ